MISLYKKAKVVKPIEVESRMLVARGWVRGGNGEVLKGTKFQLLYKMNKS